MKRPYETMVIFDGSLPEDTLKKEQEKIEKFLQEQSDFEKTVVWGKRQLSYEIRKKKSGDFYLFLYNGENNVSAALEKTLKLNDYVLRVLSVVRDMRQPERPAGLLDDLDNDDSRGDRRYDDDDSDR